VRHTLKTKKIHSTSIIEDSVVLGCNVEVGPYTVIEGNTTIGDGTKIGPFCHLGGMPQDPNYSGEKTTLVIGKNCRLSNYVMIDSGSKNGGTQIGDNCFFMTHSGIAHDTKIGNNCTFSVNAGTVGECIVEEGAFFGIGAKIHQQVRIGRISILGGNSFVARDVLPYSMIEHGKMRGVNLVGLKRNGFTTKQIKVLIHLYKILLEKQMTFDSWKKMLPEHLPKEEIGHIIKFIDKESARHYTL